MVVVTAKTLNERTSRRDSKICKNERIRYLCLAFGSRSFKADLNSLGRILNKWVDKDPKEFTLFIFPYFFAASL